MNLARSYSDWCEHCNVPMYIQYTEAVLTCPQCGKSRLFIPATSNRVAFGEEVNLSTFTYKRQGHLEDVLSLFNGNPPLTEEDLRDLMYVLYYVCGVRDPNDLTPSHIKSALALMKKGPYYRRFKQQLFYQLCGYVVPTMDPEMQTRILQRFAAIQPIFEEVKPEDRQHFIRYRFYAYKGCELEGADEFLPFLPLLKGEKNMVKLDQIFESICQKINWEFIPTKPRFVWSTETPEKVAALVHVLMEDRESTKRKKSKTNSQLFYIQHLPGEDHLYDETGLSIYGKNSIVRYLTQWQQ